MTRAGAKPPGSCASRGTVAVVGPDSHKERVLYNAVRGRKSMYCTSAERPEVCVVPGSVASPTIDSRCQELCAM
jgi:hypothetical protein